MADTSHAALEIPQVPVLMRPHKSSDINLILSDWLRDLRPAFQFKKLPSQEYFSKMQTLIAELVNEPSADTMIKRPRAHIVVAADPEEPDIVYGWICGVPADYAKDDTGKLVLKRKPVIHYCYIRAGFRRWGIGTRLAEQLGYTIQGGLDYTILCRGAARVVGKRPRITYNPFFLWGICD